MQRATAAQGNEGFLSRATVFRGQGAESPPKHVESFVARIPPATGRCRIWRIAMARFTASRSPRLLITALVVVACKSSGAPGVTADAALPPEDGAAAVDARGDATDPPLIDAVLAPVSDAATATPDARLPPPPDATMPDAVTVDASSCTASSKEACAAMPGCAPACTGTCDCTCPGPAGHEGCGCADCAESCFVFAECEPADPAVKPCGPSGRACDEKTELCVSRAGGIGIFWDCVPVPPGCTSDRTCACAGDELCGGVDCFDDRPDSDIACVCALCA